jgi:hypothetical protein
LSPDNNRSIMIILSTSIQNEVLTNISNIANPYKW